jgi:aspartate aminotransferase-like enzyme
MMLLVNPGPVTLTERVRRSLLQPVPPRITYAALHDALKAAAL